MFCMFRIALLILAAVSSKAIADGDSAALPETNILIITVDDMNWDSVGAYGSPVPEVSPNIDQLAADGMRFEYAHITVPVCVPSRAALMTGRYPHLSGATGFGEINDETTTLVEELRRAGYLTGLIGKTRHTVASRAGAWHYRIDRGLLDNGRHPDKFERYAEQFLVAKKADVRPFFLQINIHDPHRPFAGAKQEAEYQPLYQTLGWWHYPKVVRAYGPDQVAIPSPLPDLPGIRKELAQYFTSVKRADETVGRITRLLDKHNLADNTLVVFLSDHGMALPYAKSTLYMYGTRTPLIIRFPGGAAGGTVDNQHVVSGIDLMPTILEMAGLPVPDKVDGSSLVPLLKGKKSSDHAHAITYFFETIRKDQYPSRAINGTRYGYIYNAWPDGKKEFVLDDAQSGYSMAAMAEAAKNNADIAQRVGHYLYRTREEFYDYEADPGAHHNLIDSPEFAGMIQGFRRELLAHLRSTRDPMAREFSEHVARHREAKK